MRLEESSYREAANVHIDEVFQELKLRKPRQVVALLEKNGWPREWACNIVADVEINDNPAKLKRSPEENQILRERYSSRVFFGAAILFVGLAVTIGSLFLAHLFGGFAIIAYGAVLWGGATLWSGLSNVGLYPDRQIPVFRTPQVGEKEHDPESY